MSLKDLIRINGVLPEFGDTVRTKSGRIGELLLSPEINVAEIRYFEEDEINNIRLIHMSEIESIIRKRK